MPAEPPEQPWPPEEEFPDRLHRLRRKLRLDNAAIGDAVGVEAKTVSHWVGGIQKPESEQLLKLAETLFVTPQWLLKGEGSGTLVAVHVTPVVKKTKPAPRGAPAADARKSRGGA